MISLINVVLSTDILLHCGLGMELAGLNVFLFMVNGLMTIGRALKTRKSAMRRFGWGPGGTTNNNRKEKKSCLTNHVGWAVGLPRGSE